MEQQRTKRKIKVFGTDKGFFKGLKGKKLIKIVSWGLFFFAFLFVGGVVFLSLQSKATGKIPTIAGYQIYSVEGGSMEPNIKRGSVVFLKRPEDFSRLKEDDVITYISVADRKTIVTHRIVEVIRDGDEVAFVTRGDANDINDFDPVPSHHIIGQVKATLPYVGYLMSFAKTGVGLITLVIIPGVLIILLELLNLRRELVSIKRKKREMLLEKLREGLLPETAQGGRE